MSGGTDHDFEAIERRLAARADRVAPAGHRDRVLAAVRDTLAERTVPPATPAGLDSQGTAALVTIALSALLAVVAPWLVVTQIVNLLPTEPRIVVQARAAGIDLPAMLVATAAEPARKPRADTDRLPPSRIHGAWRLRKNLTGDL